MANQANKSRRAVSFQVGQKVWLSTANIRTDRPSKKLDHKWIGPFTILEAKGSAYKLDLPATIKIYNVFHASLLTLDPNDPLPGQEFEEPPPVVVDNEQEWEVEDIINVRKR